ASVACPINCHCDYGMSGILLGIFVILAAGVFTFFPVFLNWFAWEWYFDLCWFCLGVVILTFGCVYECCVGAPDAKARKAEADVEWYFDLCWLWFFLGVVILTFGCVYECSVGAPDAKARKAEADVEGGAVNAPVPYIVINN
ncbi:unnamed protein product, partial [Prorocentrum cordatum]